MAGTTPIPAPPRTWADRGSITEQVRPEPREQGRWVTPSLHALTSRGGAEMGEKLGQQFVCVSRREPPRAGRSEQ